MHIRSLRHFLKKTRRHIYAAENFYFIKLVMMKGEFREESSVTRTAGKFQTMNPMAIKVKRRNTLSNIAKLITVGLFSSTPSFGESG